MYILWDMTFPWELYLIEVTKFLTSFLRIISISKGAPYKNHIILFGKKYSNRTYIIKTWKFFRVPRYKIATWFTNSINWNSHRYEHQLTRNVISQTQFGKNLPVLAIIVNQVQKLWIRSFVQQSKEAIWNICS